MRLAKRITSRNTSRTGRKRKKGLPSTLMSKLAIHAFTLGTPTRNRIGDQERTVQTGISRSYNGVDQYTDYGDIEKSVKSITFRVKLASTTEKLIQLNAAQNIEVVSGTITANNLVSPSIYVDNVAGSTLDTTYHRVIITSETGFVLSALELGRIDTTYGEFEIHDLRAFENVLTANERASLQEFEQLETEVFWDFLESTDLNVSFDASGEGNNGTNSAHDVTSFAETNNQSLFNKHGYNVNVDDGVDIPRDLTAVGNTIIDGNEITLSVESADGANETNYWEAGQTYLISISVTNYSGVANRIIPPYDGSLQPASRVQGNGDMLYTYTSNSGSLWIYSYDNAGATITVNFIKRYYDTPVPPDMSTVINGIPQFDVFGNSLTYKGQAKYNLLPVSTQILGDGVITGTVTGLLTTDTITAESDDVPICTTNGVMTFADEGEYYGIRVERGGVLWAFYPACERSGSTIYDVVNGHHITITSYSAGNRTDQESYHYLQDFGCTKVTYSGTTVYIPYKSDGTPLYPDISPVLNAAETAVNYSQTGVKAIPGMRYKLPEVYELIQADHGNYFFQSDDTPNELLVDDLLQANYVSEFFYINRDRNKDLIIVADTITAIEDNKLIKFVNTDERFYVASTSGTGDGETQEWTLRLPVGDTMIIHWGDGDYTEIEGQGDSTDINLSHTYITSGDYDIYFEADYANLTYLYCSSNNLTGDVSGWSALTNLTYLSCRSNNLTGDVSGWSALTNLGVLSCNSNALTGDVSGWSALTNLIYLRCYSNALDFSNQTTWAALELGVNCNFTNNGMSSEMVNNALISFAAGPFQNTTINIITGNAARTSASDVAVATLEAAGCTIE